jgi:hypothetical protein
VTETSVWQLAVFPRAEAYCGATPTEWLPFLGTSPRTSLRQRRVVDHQHRVGATDQPVRLHEQFGLQRCGIPQASSNEMVQLVIVTRHKPLCHRLHALAIAGTDETRNIPWAHSPPRLVAQAS